MITSNVLTRVFHLKYGMGTGTCFAIDWNNRQYIVTAKHVIENFQSGSKIQIFYKGNWAEVTPKLVGHHQTADVSVLTLDISLASLKMDPTSDGIILGQDTYFLGFPYQLSDLKSSQINRDFPFPLIKKATLSAMLNDGFGNYMLLDGFNNPGFSGGPVVFAQPYQTKIEYKVGGIISGYRYSEDPVYQTTTLPPLVVRSNTGIIIAYDIANAIELINANPIGIKI